METVTINGAQWRRKPEQPRKKMPKSVMTIMTMAAMFGGGFETPRSRLPNVDIVKEYELIQQKKSNLSRSQRDAVVRHFERYFEKVQD